MWDDVLLIAGIVLASFPALALGARGMFRHRGYVAGDPGDRPSIILMIVVRAVTLLLLLAASAITLLSCVGALVEDVELHGMVYAFFVLALLLSSIVLLTFGRTERRPARRRATPARR